MGKLMIFISFFTASFYAAADTQDNNVFAKFQETVCQKDWVGSFDLAKVCKASHSKAEYEDQLNYIDNYCTTGKIPDIAPPHIRIVATSDAIANLQRRGRKSPGLLGCNNADVQEIEADRRALEIYSKGFGDGYSNCTHVRPVEPVGTSR